jgi:hypothetical protein
VQCVATILLSLKSKQTQSFLVSEMSSALSRSADRRSEQSSKFTMFLAALRGCSSRHFDDVPAALAREVRNDAVGDLEVALLDGPLAVQQREVPSALRSNRRRRGAVRCAAASADPSTSASDWAALPGSTAGVGLKVMRRRCTTRNP